MAVARAQSDRSFRVHEMVVQARATVHMGVACGVVGAMHGARVRGRVEFGRGRRRGANHGPEHQGIRAVSAEGGIPIPGPGPAARHVTPYRGCGRKTAVAWATYDWSGAARHWRRHAHLADATAFQRIFNTCSRSWSHDYAVDIPAGAGIGRPVHRVGARRLRRLCRLRRRPLPWAPRVGG